MGILHDASDRIRESEKNYQKYFLIGKKDLFPIKKDFVIKKDVVVREKEDVAGMHLSNFMEFYA